MSGIDDSDERKSASFSVTRQASAREMSQPTPIDRLAAMHSDCPCYVDPRCQITIVQEYWEKQTDDKKSAPNELLDSKGTPIGRQLLEGRPRTIHEEPEEESTPDENTIKRSGRRFSRIRPLNLRRLSLPTGETLFSVPLLSPTRIPRRNTDGEIANRVHIGGQEDTIVHANQASPRNLLRVFRSAKHKRTSNAFITRSKHVQSDDANRHDASTASSSTSFPETASAGSDSVSEQNLQFDSVSEDALSIYEDAFDALFYSGASTSERLTDDAVPSYRNSQVPDPNKEQVPRATPAISDTDAETPADTDPDDPAYSALMPILYELDAFSERSRYAAIAASHDDPDYARFWEAFAQLSAREVLLAVYALRAGAFDEPHIMVVGNESPARAMAVAALTLWAVGASALVVYLYCCSQ
ncbi:hypothetical protein C2E23DRAFT_890728 [Lenzites betulinus]|nr:hypothetical protein C2E23DRAFT_890728 [Lenzites betulinus]